MEKPLRHKNLESLTLPQLEQKKRDINACIMWARNQEQLDKYVEQLSVAQQLYDQLIGWVTSPEWEE